MDIFTTIGLLISLFLGPKLLKNQESNSSFNEEQEYNNTRKRFVHDNQKSEKHVNEKNNRRNYPKPKFR